MTARWSFPGEDFSDALSIRFEVFSDEQGYLPRGETDPEDADAIHLVCLEADAPVAAGRIIRLDDDRFLIGRICVKRELRGQNIGAQVVRLLLEKCRETGAKTVLVRAQIHARGFYERMGFSAYGKTYTAHGVRHIDMMRTV